MDRLAPLAISLVIASLLATASSCRPAESRGAPADRPSTVAGLDAADASRPEEAPSDCAEAGFAVLPDRTPRDVIETLHELHQRAAYSRMGDYLVADCAADCLAFLMAIDEVLAANEHLQNVSDARFHGAVRRNWDLSVMGDNLGPFSREMRIIREQVESNAAVVTLQEANQIPLHHARLTLVDGAWRLRPEACPPHMVRELRRLTGMLRDVAQEIDKGAGTRFIDDTFVYRIVPQINRIRNLDDLAPSESLATGNVEP